MADVDSGFIGVRADIEDADIDTVATGRPAIGTDRKNKLCIVFNVSLVYDGKDTLVFSSDGIETLGKARHFVLHWTWSALLEISDIQVIINNESMQRVCKEYVESMQRVWREYVESMQIIYRKYVESMQRVWREYGESMDRVLREYVEIMKRICREYVESMQRVCREYVESMERVCR